MIFSRAPVRICDIGGWTDTWFYKKGAVCNLAVDLYSHVRVEPSNDKIIKIISENLDIDTEIKNFRKIEYDGVLDLLKAAVKRMNISQGLNIYVKADAPPGCGTGTSASIAVAILSALSYLKKSPLLPYEAAELAHKVETEELGLESGVQDQYAAAFGGINFMEIEYPFVKRSSVNISDSLRCLLENQLILVYLSSRSSSQMHQAVIKNFQNGDNETLNLFEIIKKTAYKMKDALLAENISEMGKVMNENWDATKQLHEHMANNSINSLEHLAKENGAIGFKVNGAGGGGSATVLAGIGYEYNLKTVLLENGFTILPCKLNFSGVEVWHYNQ